MEKLNTWMLTQFVAAQTMLEAKEEGQGMVEYSLILVLISVVALVIIGTLGGQVTQVFTEISDAFGAVLP